MKPLKPEEDALGQEVWAYYNGKEVFEVVERDDGYVDVGGYLKIYFSDYDEWSAEEKKAMEFVKERVLDVGCGAGRHLLYLQRKGFNTLGIDVSHLALKVCKLRGAKKTRLLAVEDVDFKPSSFDTIIMMGNNFGLFGSFNKAKRLLKKFHKMTSEDALIIAGTRDPYKTDNPAHLEYHALNRKRGRIAGQARIRIRFGKYASRWFDYLLVSKEEMKEILRETGWRIKDFIESDSANYIALIEKAPKALQKQ
jgi:SAM-dependent methyltransferase